MTANSPNVKIQNIHEFERIDKHSLPLVVAAAVTSGNLKVTGSLRKVKLTPLAKPPAEIGTEAVDLYWLQGSGRTQEVQVQSIAGMTVLFGPAKAPVQAFRDLADTVGEIIGSLPSITGARNN